MISDMDKTLFSNPLELSRIDVTGDFWAAETELVRKKVLPYEWDMLNDRVEGASKSYCMHNFRAAGERNRKRKEEGSKFKEPLYTFRGFEVLPKDKDKPEEDSFYGFVFQDSDFSKWIEAVGYSLINHPDKELEKIADEAIDTVCLAQQENGYLDTYYILNGMDKIFTNLRDHHELYCFGHLVEGAVSYYEATGKDKLLKAACRFADFIDSYFGREKGKCKGYPGHEIAEMALIRLYECTGEVRYLNLASFFIDERGKKPYYFDKEHPVPKDAPKIRYEYHQAHLPVRQQKEAVGHAVRGVYLYSAMADMARLGCDDSLFAACENLWNSIICEKMYVTGGIGATCIGESFSYPYDLPNDSAYAETCASIGLVFFAYRMLRISPKSVYGDVMELALYNTVLSGMGRDGESFFYVNPLEVNPKAKDERLSHVKTTRQKWFGCACCPPNLARIVSSIGKYAYTETDDTLFVHLYVGGTVRKKVHGKDVSLQIHTDIPKCGNVRLTVNGNGKTDMTVAFRIPAWCRDEFEIPKFSGKNVTERDGYLYISGAFEDGEEIVLSFPMCIKVLEASGKVREDEGKLVITRGPVVYCMEEEDNGADLHRIRVVPEKGFRCYESREIAGTEAMIIEGYGKRPSVDRIDRNSDASKTVPYRPYVKTNYDNVSLKLIPYYLWANRSEGEMSVFIRYQM